MKEALALETKENKDKKGSTDTDEVSLDMNGNHRVHTLFSGTSLVSTKCIIRTFTSVFFLIYRSRMHALRLIPGKYEIQRSVRSVVQVYMSPLSSFPPD